MIGSKNLTPFICPGAKKKKNANKTKASAKKRETLALNLIICIEVGIAKDLSPDTFRTFISLWSSTMRVMNALKYHHESALLEIDNFFFLPSSRDSSACKLSLSEDFPMTVFRKTLLALNEREVEEKNRVQMFFTLQLSS